MQSKNAVSSTPTSAKISDVNQSVFGNSNYLLGFLLLVVLLILDRLYTLINFGFVYTDIDQVIMWNGATDYAQGIFHEPFFYGQPYNYMIEAFVASPLVKFGVPVYIALPLVTSFIAILPFVVLACFFYRKRAYFWSYLTLALLIALPLEHNLITTISRGFVQAHLFVPFLFIPFFNPTKKKYIGLLYIAAALCFVANPSSLVLICPLFLVVYSYHYKSVGFYLKSLWVVPILVVDFFAKNYYVHHPDRLVIEFRD